MPRPSNTHARRCEIVAALRALLPELGYERASVAAIAEAAGLSSGLVHYHFRNKQEILIELVAALFAALRERYERRLAGATACGPWREVDAFIEAHVARGPDADPEALACWVVVAAEAVRQPEVREVYARALESAASLLEDHLRTALRTEARCEQAARGIAATLLSAIHGAFALASTAPATLPQGFAAENLKRTARALVEAAPRPTTHESRGRTTPNEPR